MPPQQPDRLLDLFDKSFDFSAHGFLYGSHPSTMVGDLAAKVAKRNRVEHEQTGKTARVKIETGSYSSKP